MRSTTRLLVLLPLLLALPQAHAQRMAASPRTQAANDAPQARRGDTVEQAFGLSMPDPYRWMEGETNAEFSAWLKAQGDRDRARLDAQPTLQSWRTRLGKAAASGTQHRGFRLVGERVFFVRELAGKEGVLMVRETDGREHTVYDPNTEQAATIANYSPSPDGSKTTINIGRGGDEVGEVAVYDVATGKRLADTLKPVWSEFNPSWLPDGSGFFYTRMRDVAAGDADALQGMASYVHRLGRLQAQDTLIARADGSAPLKVAAHDFPSIVVTHGSDWAVLRISGARASMRACVAPVADAAAGKARWRCLMDDADNIQDADLHGNVLYLLQAKDAPNRRVVAIDLRDAEGSLATAKVVVPERGDAVLTEFAPARDALYVKTMRGGIDTIERVDYASGAASPVALPFAGSSYLMRTDPLQDGALLSLEGWTTPRKVYRFDPANGTLHDTGLGTLTPLSYPDLVAEEVQATSADGTRVPLSIVYRKDNRKDRSARALVMGYGGYGSTSQPFFYPLFLEWPQAGNVFADCHVRGGGENGDNWRLGGKGANKQRGVEDFIACADELARRGLSAPARTAGFAGSMGGVLAGGAYVTAPDHYGAMVIAAGVLNPVRLGQMKNGANQFAEVGDPGTAEGMGALHAMDPYQRVRAGTAYPPLLLIVGLTDQRVVPWNSGKFGAAVRHASPSTPVWFRTDGGVGHFATSDSAQANEFADIFAFLDSQLKAP